MLAVAERFAHPTYPRLRALAVAWHTFAQESLLFFVAIFVRRGDKPSKLVFELTLRQDNTQRMILPAMLFYATLVSVVSVTNVHELTPPCVKVADKILGARIIRRISQKRRERYFLSRYDLVENFLDS